ncbi:MAG: BamA/TamA family outer membrane protein [Paludibacteraceae bacterium]|nr:BamA/TamA family outer membrane protein [Paludibacteraceae bacterium]
MKRHNVYIILLTLLLTACNATKFVPEGKYLLNKTKVEVTDNKQVSPSDLKAYLRQKPNSEVLGFWKLQLDIYNTAPSDTSTSSRQRLARNAHKLGEAPEIYDDALTTASMYQLKKAMHNYGYFHSEVDTVQRIKNRKMYLTYKVTANQPYHLRSCTYVLPYQPLKEVANNRRRTLIKDGMLFDTNVFDAERQRIVSAMRRRGYYYMEKDILRVLADSAVGNKQVDAEIRLSEAVENMPDSLQKRLFQPYTVRKVYFHTDYNPNFAPDSLALLTKETGDYVYTWVGRRLLRDRALRHNCAIEPGELFNERDVERTYEMLNGLGIVKYVDITFKAVGDSLLDCHIVLSRTKLHTVSAEVEGTYSGGDWGISAGVGYINRNIFRGAEELQLSGSGGYEWRQNGGRAIEGKVAASLTFPIRLQLALSYQYQTRPDEFTRSVANASLLYTLPSYRRGWTHTFRFLDLTYVYVPWMSSEFEQRFVNNNNPLKYSYESHLIEAIGYSARYSGYRRNQPARSFSEARFNIETAGNVPYAAAKGMNLKKSDGVYKFADVAFAQYVKADVSYTFNHVIVPKHRMVYHIGLGVAFPYGNSEAVPYERRYFAGGSNHVRGWTARSLGPGAYHSTGSRIDYDNQAGDIQLAMNIEYRWKVWSIFELAAFTDAGNIWTIRNYSTQPNGAFRFNSFYEQIAWSYGVGLRLDLSFLIFRVDFGVRLYDPTRINTDAKAWRTAPNGLNWHDDMAFHFAIGYPF